MEVNALKKILPGQETSMQGVKDRDETGDLKEILAGCLKNKPSSQEKLYKKFYGYALATALKYSFSREEAVETVNDSFVKVFRNIGQFKPGADFKPWFRRIVVNTAIDQARTNRKHMFQLDISEVFSVEHPVDVLADLNAEEALELLKSLPALQRYVFNMYELDGYNHKEIASALEISESSSRTYLTRAKSKLRSLYKKYYQD